MLVKFSGGIIRGADAFRKDSKFLCSNLYLSHNFIVLFEIGEENTLQINHGGPILSWIYLEDLVRRGFIVEEPVCRGFIVEEPVCRGFCHGEILPLKYKYSRTQKVINEGINAISQCYAKASIRSRI